jgi:dienelactone hydrolase
LNKQFCWGGKIVSITTSKSDTPFKAGAECHPAMVDPSEALDIKIPLCMLASKDEPAEDVKKLASICESALSRWGGGWCFAGMEADGRKRGERTAKI